MATTERAPRVLLGVTGGIAAYKAPELVRRLVERGCEVQVVMSRGAREFVGPLTFQAVSGRRVRDDLWDQAAEAAMGHIELARWADIVGEQQDAWRETFVYFKHEDEGKGPEFASLFKAKLR